VCQSYALSDKATISDHNAAWYKHSSVQRIDILKLKNCLYTTIIYLDVKGRLLLVSAYDHLQVGSLDF
jgi:hypothetical protein